MTTDERIDDLERQLKLVQRLYRWLLSGVSIGVALLLASNVFPPGDGGGAAYAQGRTAVEEIVRANKFILVDASGRERAILGLVDTGAGLCLYDESAQGRAIFDGSSLTLFDDKGRQRAGLAAREDESMLTLTVGKVHAGFGALKVGAVAALSDETGVERAMLSACTRDHSGLRLYDEKGTQCTLLTARKGRSSLSLFDDTDKPVVLLGLSKAGPMLGLMDEKSTQRAVLAGGPAGAMLLLCDEHGKQRATVAVRKDLTGIQLQDSVGIRRAQLGMGDDRASFLTLENGKASASLGATPDGSQLGLDDEMGRRRARLTGSRRMARLELQRGDGEVIWSAP